jgi:nitroimidazol reductase NimA-like FMN-containing flavoprotein (pyridoxamine 5'-phosphate oxidase superfamily)
MQNNLDGDDRESEGGAAWPRADRPHMPGYGLVDANSGRGLLAWSWAAERLSKARNYFVSTTRSDGLPHSMPVWGVWMEGAFYFSTGRRSRKARNLRTNSHCVICPENADEAVVLEGVAHEIDSPAALQPMFEAYMEKYNSDLSGMDLSDNAFYRVTPRVVFGLTLGLATIATRWTFE